MSNDNCNCCGTKGTSVKACEDDKTLVRDLLKTVIMGSQAIDVTREFVESEEFDSYLTDLQKGYGEIQQRCVDFMKSHKIEEDMLGSIKEALSRGAIKMSMLGTRSDEKVAEQLIKGTTMGLDVIGKNLNCTCQVSAELIQLAEDTESMLNRSVKELRKWLA